MIPVPNWLAVLVFLELSFVINIYGLGQRVYLDRTKYFEEINVNFSWSINSKTQSIYIELIAPFINTNSWIAFGLSDVGGMKGADIGLISLHHGKI